MAYNETSKKEDQQHELDNELDIRISKPRSSRFFFLLGLFGILIFAWSGCYNLYKHKFVDQSTRVPVNESSLYEPKYK